MRAFFQLSPQRKRWIAISIAIPQILGLVLATFATGMESWYYIDNPNVLIAIWFVIGLLLTWENDPGINFLTRISLLLMLLVVIADNPTQRSPHNFWAVTYVFVTMIASAVFLVIDAQIVKPVQVKPVK